ncbi:hypothetical protein LCGC14_2494730 [marine sediment metagenome]|uniref:Uncharacterized protein n=1 Tax=marine sediment metagenome TaxID=412755 RepID=A0A0F9B3L6_9ZZZZ
MTTRYQKEHYEDVANVLASATRYSGKTEEGEYFCSVDPDEVAQALAHLFAADNPLACTDCGRLQSASSKRCPAMRPIESSGLHRFTWGFDGEQFLTACGLEEEEDQS